MKQGITVTDGNIIVPNKLRKDFLDTLQFGYAGNTEIESEAKILSVSNINKDIEEKVRSCVASVAPGKNTNCETTKNGSGRSETFTKAGQEIQIELTGKLLYKEMNGR